MQKAVIYARVSSKEQEQSGFSIPHQVKFLSDYAQKQGLTVIQVFSESMSAKDEGRIEFDKMFSFLKKNKDIQSIIVEKNDRLLRNDFDNAKIIKIATTTDLRFHLVKENLVLSKKSTPQDILFFTINSAFSSYYPRNLSNEVKKGTIEKAEQGLYPRKAPLGYIKEPYAKKHNPVIPDSETAPFIKKIFKLYATGNYSLRTLATKMTNDGFFPNKKPCTKTTVEKILKQPFYMGEFNFSGRRYQNAQHEPLISKELFYLCKDLREGSGFARTQSKDFLYKSMIRCKNCGGLLSPELKHGANKSGDYIYYRCTRSKEKNCNSKPLKGIYIDEFINNILTSINLTDEGKDLILGIVKQKYKEQTAYDEKACENIEQQTKILKNRLNKLYMDRLDGIISDNDYFDKKEVWQIELDKLDMQRVNINLENNEFMQRAENFLELCKNVYKWYFKQNSEEKRNFLKLIISNFFYDGQKLHIELKSAFETMFKNAILQKSGPGETRTLTHCCARS